MTRLGRGGLIDRSSVLGFTFDDRPLTGHPGDTVASALLANGRCLVARSSKYHRPRGILSAGLEEPSALVTVTDAAGSTPNLKVTEVPLRDGLRVNSQSAWTGLDRDAGTLLQLVSRVLGAGFYYKTFIWPRNSWHRIAAPVIRRAAGRGRVDLSFDPSNYDKRRRHCDVLIVGGGAAGLSAAVTAGQAGATTILIEQDHVLGGALLSSRDNIDGLPAPDWVEEAETMLYALSNVTVMPRTLAFGHYDHGLVYAVETPHSDSVASAILWKIRARRILLAAGAIERPVVFPGNDRPGVMLAGAVRSYIRRFAVAPGKRAAVAVADPAERADTAAALNEAAIPVVAEILPGDRPSGTRGRLHLQGVRWRDATGRRHRTSCDLLCVSAGWTPTAHLFTHLGGRLKFNAETQSLLPSAETCGPLRPIGGARGILIAADCVDDGKRGAHLAMAELGIHKSLKHARSALTPATKRGFESGRGSTFIDLQNDVTGADIALARREGYRDVELIKRYTTLGMGTDQGKTSWTNCILEIASMSSRDPTEIGHATQRPPYSPVSIGALVGTETGSRMIPIRRTPFHRIFESLGCVFQTSGDWLYPRYFPQPGEDMAGAVERECTAVRSSLGCVDMSTLGKIDVQGRDASQFLSRLYCNDVETIKPGRLRYALMLREDGYVFDDGIVARLDENHYLVTATTANTSSVWRHMLKYAQVVWPDLDVALTQVTDHWSSLSIAGPNARNLLQALDPDFCCSRDEFPLAAVREGRLGGELPARVFSASYSGELSYEINTPSGFAETLFDRAVEAGAQWEICPYGLETLDVLRVEKGHIAPGTEIDGRRTPGDLGLAAMVSTEKDFLGRALLQRSALQAGGREQLVGLVPQDRKTPIPGGAHLSDQPVDRNGCAKTLGHLTTTIKSPSLGHPIALAFLKDGIARSGDLLWAHSPVAGKSVRVQVTRNCAYDPKGTRLHV